MTDDARHETAALLAPMLRRALWVVLTQPQASSALMEPHAPAHLEYMSELEATGVLWASGPFLVPGATIGAGLTVFNVSEEAEVHRLMREEPLTKLGLRTYEVHRWELREGRISASLFCSRSSFVLT
jgi:uncharacterized protein